MSTTKAPAIHLEGEDVETVHRVSESTIVYVAEMANDMGRGRNATVSLAWLDDMRRVTEAYEHLPCPGHGPAVLEGRVAATLAEFAAGGLLEWHTPGVGHDADEAPGYLAWHAGRRETIERAPILGGAN